MKAFKDIKFYNWGFIVLVVLVIYGCQDNALNNKLTEPDDRLVNNELSKKRSLVAKLKKTHFVRDAFLNKKFDVQLYNYFNDTSSIFWKPNWEKISQKNVNDSTSYFYIPLVPQLIRTGSNHFISYVRVYNQRRFIIVKRSGASINFSLATYLSEVDSTKLIKNGAKDGIDFTRFNGSLLLNNFESGTNSFYIYTNGVNKKSSKESNTYLDIKKNKMIESRGYTTNGYTCTYVQVCDWVAACSGSATVTTTRGASSEVPGRYNCPYPYVYGCGGAQWFKTRSHIEQYCSYDDPPPLPDDPPSGGGSGSIGDTFDPSLVYNFTGQRPLAEYSDECEGAQGLWDRSVAEHKEVVGVLTMDGKVLMIAITGYRGGSFGGLYIYDGDGKAYYTYPDSEGAPRQSYSGMVHAAGHYFIPIVATIHTHLPCVDDGTDGISNTTLSDEDQDLASTFYMVNHYIIGCGAIGKFDQNSDSPTVLQRGSLSETCNSIQ